MVNTCTDQVKNRLFSAAIGHLDQDGSALVRHYTKVPMGTLGDKYWKFDDYLRVGLCCINLLEESVTPGAPVSLV